MLLLGPFLVASLLAPFLPSQSVAEDVKDEELVMLPPVVARKCAKGEAKGGTPESGKRLVLKVELPGTALIRAVRGYMRNARPHGKYDDLWRVCPYTNECHNGWGHFIGNYGVRDVGEGPLRREVVWTYINYLNIQVTREVEMVVEYSLPSGSEVGTSERTTAILPTVSCLR